MEAQSKYAQLSEVKLHYLDWEGATGTPLIVLPGLAGSAHNWSHVAAALAEARRVIVLEERGQGLSQRKPDYRLDVFVRDLGEFADKLGLELFCLLGASLGGRVAYRFAAHNAGRLERLIIVDIPPARPHPAAELPPPEHTESFSGPQEALESLRRLGSLVDEAFFKDRFVYNYRRRKDGRYVHAHDPRLERHTREELKVLREDDFRLLRKIDEPTLIIHGERSPVPLEELKRAADAIERAELVEIPDAGHAVHLDNPAALIAAVRDFLT